jgi:hypothetical protein
MMPLYYQYRNPLLFLYTDITAQPHRGASVAGKKTLHQQRIVPEEFFDLPESNRNEAVEDPLRSSTQDCRMAGG